MVQRLMLLIWVLFLGVPVAGGADAGEAPFISRMAAGGDYHLRILGYGITTLPIDAPRNPDNRILNIARYDGTVEARLDFKLDFNSLAFSFQPRALLQWEAWRDGPWVDESRRDATTYIHQWRARGCVSESLFISYGRENLQWGPAYLISLSNPFYADNGRSNPKMEVPAADFARAVWVPNSTWSVSLIANTGSGRSNPNLADGFSEGWAAKVDYSGVEDYGSLILSTNRADRRQIGGFYGGTVSDALLLYMEGALLQYPGGLYAELADTPLGLSMLPHDDRAAWRATGLAGASYTLAAGPTFSAEYLYYGPGYDSAEAGRYFELQTRAARAVLSSGPFVQLGYGALGRSADPGLRFLRQNYLMLQCVKSDIAGALDLTGRWTQNLDDGSGRFTGIGEWAIGDHVKLFSVGTANRGVHFTEFGSIFDYQIMLGMEYML